MCPDLTHSSSEKFTTLSLRQKRTSRRGSWKVSKDLLTSFRYATKGLAYGLLTQRNFRVHLLLGGITFVLGLWLQLSAAYLAIMTLTVASVLVLELINTSIEAVVDLSIGRRFHPLAGIAKDCAAAAVLVAAITSLVVASLLLFPAVLNRLGF